jgi:uncharacterized membrane protein
VSTQTGSHQPPKLSGKQGPPASLALAMAATLVGLALGYAIKRQCAVHGWIDNFQYSHLCYNDLQPLFGIRGISRGLLPYRDVQIEYPVLTGMFMDLTGRVLRGLVKLGIMDRDSDSAYLAVSSVFLAPFAVWITLLLRPRVTRARLMLWAMGTPIVMYAFHNWDLLAVAGATWGLVEFERHRHATAGVGLAAGASAKLYPVFLAPGAFLDRLTVRDWRGARRLVLGFGAAYLALNLPWFLISGGAPHLPKATNVAELAKQVSLRAPGTNGWVGVWLFHAKRYPDFGTVWYWLAKYGRHFHPAAFWDPGQTGYRNFVSLVSLAMFGLGSLWLLWLQWRRRTPEGYPVVAAGLGIVCLFLLTSKVHSPQYALWVVPLLVMLDTPWRFVFAYLAADLALFISGFYWFTVMDTPSPAWLGIFEATVWARAAALAALVLASLKANRLLPAPAEPEPSPQPAQEGSLVA